MTILPAPLVHLGESRLGILWALASVAGYSTMDAIAKELTQTLPLAEIVLARFAIPLLIVAIVLNRRLPEHFVSPRSGLQLLRGAMLIASTVFFYAGVSVLPLAEATAITFVGPPLITALSVPFLGERVGVRRWVGVAVGFVGMLIIVRPGMGVMAWAALLPIGAATCYAFNQILTRKLRAAARPFTTALWTLALGSALATMAAPFTWVAPPPETWALAILLGVIAIGADFAIIKAVTLAPVSVIAPLSYLPLVFATIFGYVFFGDWPDVWTFVGAFIIVASGLYIFHRERVRAGAS